MARPKIKYKPPKDTPLKFDTFSALCGLEPGESLIYYTGNLARDLALSIEGTEDHEELTTLQKTANDLHERGKVKLVQKKVGINFEYIAQACRGK